MKTINPLTVIMTEKRDITSKIQSIGHFIAANRVKGCQFIAAFDNQNGVLMSLLQKKLCFLPNNLDFTLFVL